MAYKIWIHIEDTKTEQDYDGCLPIPGPVFDNVQDAIDFAEEMEG